MAPPASRIGANALVLRAMLVKNLLTTFRYPANVVGRVARLFVALPLFLLATAMFWKGGIHGMIAAPDGRILGRAMIYGFVLYEFTSDSLWLIGSHVRQEQIEGTLESLCVTPASRTTYLLSRMAEPLALSGLNGCMAFAAASWLFGLPPLAHAGTALYALAAIVGGVVGLGFALAAFTLLFHDSAIAAASMGQFLLLALCAMVFPFHALPPAILCVSKIIPMSYAVDLFRAALTGYAPGYPELAPPSFEIAVSAAWGLGMPLLGCLAYRAAERHARRAGLLGRF